MRALTKNFFPSPSCISISFFKNDLFIIYSDAFEITFRVQVLKLTNLKLYIH